MQQHEQDFPEGHPARFDYDPASAVAKEWARLHVFPKGERDYPPDHPGAVDTPGNKNAVQWRAGIDPARPEHEEFTGRSPEQAAAVRAANAAAARTAKESPALEPIVAPTPEEVERAVIYVMEHGYTRYAAENIIAREGIQTILAQMKAGKE